MAVHTASTGPAQQRSSAGPIARRIIGAARIVQGLIFFVFGLNGFFMFLPQPKMAIPAAAAAFFLAMMKTGYLVKLIAATQLVVGILLLTNRYVPLALALIAPVIVNIFAFHLFLEPSGLGLASVVAILEIYLAWSYREAYRPMLAARAPVLDPGSASAMQEHGDGSAHA